VAKILVADDNSNVQKTVAQALTDLGVEVVSVNNGDAAIKRFADILPDMVLADIFMPVRNGYEVCEYVKKNSNFAHVPVVLLVGAFDPLDEREAQRVGADGILKKPFAPPDPLLTMVKTLLDRSMAERLVTVAAPKPAADASAKTASATTAEPPQHLAPVEPDEPEEISPIEVPAPASKVSFGDGERPVAFGQLLDAPAQSAAPGTGVVEPTDDAQVLTGSRDAALGDPIFWKDEGEPEGEENEADTEEELRQKFSQGDPGGWDEAEEAEPSRAAEKPPVPVHAAESALPPDDAFELVRDEADEPSHKTSTIVDSKSVLQDPASVSPLNVQAGRAQDLATNPIEWMATAPPVPKVEEPPAASNEPAQFGQKKNAIEPVKIEKAKEPAAAPPPISPTKPISVPDPISLPSMNSTPASVPPPTKASVPPPASPPLITPPPKAPAPVKAAEQKPEDTARSMPKQDWEDLASTIQTKPVPSVPESLKTTPPRIAPPPPAPVQSTAKSQPTPPKPPQAVEPDPAVVDAVMQRVTATLHAKPGALAPESLKAPAPPPPTAPPAPAPVQSSKAPEPTTPKAPQSAEPDPAMVDAVVQRVLDKMKPQVLDVITKELLKPIVQALVHREVDKT